MMAVWNPGIASNEDLCEMRDPKAVQPREDYSARYLVGLFNEMAQTYGVVNLLSSFGFSHFWRKSCIEALEVCPDSVCADLMSGMGESSLLLYGRGVTSIHAVDFSPAMTDRARAMIAQHGQAGVKITAMDVFDLNDSAAFDRICVSFGIKTLDNEGLERFATLLCRLLRPGGRASLVEIHLPAFRPLLWPYLFYLRYVIPLIGRMCLGNPDCYRSLAIYTESFARRERFAARLHLDFSFCSRSSK